MSEISLRQRKCGHSPHLQKMRQERNSVLLLLCATCSQQHSEE